MSERRRALTVWWRQAAGIFRAAQRSSLRLEVLTGRLSWIFGGQAVLAACAALAIHQVGARDGLTRLPPEAGAIALSIALVLLLAHALVRLGSVSADVLRDVDEKVLEVYEGSPLAASAYVGGRTLFHVVEQGVGLAAFLPSLALASAMGAFDVLDFLTLSLAMLAVSLLYGLLAMGRVLGAVARRERGSALPPGRRQGTGTLVAQALLGLLAAFIAFSYYRLGFDLLGPLVVAFSLTPAAPVVGAAYDQLLIGFFGMQVGTWLPATLCLGLMTPFAWASTRLAWKPPLRASGADLRLGFALLWLAPALVLSGTLRSGVGPSVFALLVVGGLGALVLPAWAAGGRMADLGGRPGAARRGLLSARKETAAPWAWLVQGGILLLLGALAPVAPGAGRSAFLLLALAAWAGTTPILLLTAALARRLALRGPAGQGLVVLFGLLASGGGVLAPQVLDAVGKLPLLGGLSGVLAGPGELLAAASPVLILYEAAQSLLDGALSGHRLTLDEGWSLGLPYWQTGLVVQGLLCLPTALWLNRSAARKGR